MRIGSLFSGAGMLDYAVQGVFGGFNEWHCEVDPAASAVLAHRFLNVPNLGDITKVDWARTSPVDILCGGFPCQDVSAAGARAGIRTGTRSGLWAEFARAIDYLQPRIVVIENVRGLLSATAHRDMESADPTVGNGAGRPVLRAAGAVLGDLADLGYDASWSTLSASSVGAPHRRERVFIVATNPDNAARYGQRACSQLGEGSVLAADTEGVGWSTSDVARTDVVEDGPQLAHPGSHGGVVELLPTPCAARSGNNQSASPGAAVRPSLDMITELFATPQSRDYKGVPADGFNNANLCRDVALLQTPSVADALGGHLARSGARGDEPLLPGQAKAMDGQQWGKYEAAIRRWENVTRPAPSPTEPNKNGNPRLSARFSEWLMGWPDGWVTDVPGISRNDQLRIIGNGVCVQQGIAALRHLVNLQVVA